MEKIANWFDSLKNTKQIDDYLEALFKDTVGILGQVINSFNILSTNQKLVFGVAVVVTIYCINFAIFKSRKFIHKLKVEYRRRKIPDNINLNLDRDAGKISIKAPKDGL